MTVFLFVQLIWHRSASTMTVSLFLQLFWRRSASTMTIFLFLQLFWRRSASTMTESPVPSPTLAQFGVYSALFQVNL
ncbi:hypothetical protein LG311_20210 [Sutcliffiella horikoshii]|uniref:hypothetical protein n=1 Tax=Sutcliffiella horikoshii TaxID=79883 RepID=UPI003850B3AB